MNERPQRNGALPSPGPSAMTTPPAQAPSALPRLKAAMLKLDARLCPAPAACSSTHICMGATVAKAAAPSSPTKSDGGSAACMAKCIAPSTAARADQRAEDGRQGRDRPGARRGDCQATRPPPNTSRIGETAASDEAGDRVSGGAM